jgi:hypothetical protein
LEKHDVSRGRRLAAFLRVVGKSLGLVAFSTVTLFLVTEYTDILYIQMDTKEKLLLCLQYSFYPVILLWVGVGILFLFKIIKVEV